MLKNEGKQKKNTLTAKRSINRTEHTKLVSAQQIKSLLFNAKID